MVVEEGDGAWGTWEMLILAGAVLRHGTQSWEAITSEIRARTLYPFSFTPEVCEAKYKLLRKQYRGCKALFEDLKKRRVEELRKELAKSDDSIGSLETKLETLKTEKESNSQTDAPTTPVVKSEGFESFGKDSSKDGLSAGSFTQDITKTTKPETSCVSDQEKVSSFKRGEETANENGDSENVGSANVVTSTMRCPSLNVSSRGSGNEYLMTVLNSIAEKEFALPFRQKHDSQKRARYRKMVKRHVDFDTLRSSIANFAISSMKELFRDLFLLANNALVFYSKRTREYKSALLLRETVTNSYKKHCKGARFRELLSFCILPMFPNLPVKPRSARPHPRKFKLSTIVPVDDTNNSVDIALKRCEKTRVDTISVMGKKRIGKNASDGCLKPSNEALTVGKKSIKRRKVGGGSVNGQAKTVMNEKKKLRRI